MHFLTIDNDFFQWHKDCLNDRELKKEDKIKTKYS
jgi:hypothetical protein